MKPRRPKCGHELEQTIGILGEVGMSTKSEASKLKRSNWYDDPRMTDEQKREAVKQYRDWCERKWLLPSQGSWTKVRTT
jgi:hypothetical protein